MKKPAILPALGFLLLSGCGGSGGGSSWSGPRNDTGFPAVAGTYAINYSELHFTCSDGSGGTSPARSENVTVTQNGNQITFASDSPGFTAGFTVTRSRNATGIIGTNADFTADRAIEGEIDGVGSAAVNTFFAGDFFASGFSGDSESTATFLNIGGSCKYDGTFDATKIG